MTPEQYFKDHGVSRIEDLSHEGRLVFALKFMDYFSQTSVRYLLSGAFGQPIDPLPDETDSAINEAYNKGLSFCAAYVVAEGVKRDENTYLGTPGYVLSVEDRRDLLKDFEEESWDKPKHNIYVASSWKNPYYPNVVKSLREAGFDVYDFRNPRKGSTGFHWTDIDENAPNWTFQQYKKGLDHPAAFRQFRDDLDALNWADTCVLVLPCGRSAHTEAGWMAGLGKRVIAYFPEMQEPELMYKLFDDLVDNIPDLIRCLGGKQDEFTTEMHLEMMEKEMDRQEFYAWAAYGAIKRGATKAEALAKYKVSEEFYDQVIAREQQIIDASPDSPIIVENKTKEDTPPTPYKAPDGTIYPSYQAYCDDPNLDTDIIQCKLMSGERKPQNDFERSLLKAIEEARKAGTYLEIYPE